MKNRTLVLFGIGVVGITLFGVTQVSAQNSDGLHQSLIQKIAQRFNLNEGDVRTVFEEAKNEQRSKMQDRFNQMLDQAVKDGKITAAQKQLILNKRQEMQNTKQNFRDMTPEQRKEAMQKQRQESENWAKQNSIDLKYFFGGHKFLGGFKGRWK